MSLAISLPHLTLGGPGMWFATRSAGVITLLLLTASMVLGILNAARFGNSSWPRFLVQGLHRNFSLLAVAFLLVHIITNIIDTYVTIGIQDAIIPFIGSYQPFWLGLGAIASDIMLIVALTSLGRQRLGHRGWRLVHWAAYVSWPVAIVHTIGIGTDKSTTWMLIVLLVCIVSVLGALGYRAMQLFPARGVVR